MDIKEIEIPIFLHPHLFWIFWRKDTKKRLQLQNDIAKEYSRRLKLKDEDFYVGEVIVIKKNLIWKRAVIEDISESSICKYEVWLIDYGHLEHTNEVYKLNPKFNLIQQPALVQQASLWNVVFINEDLNVENNSKHQHRNTLPNAGATLIALQFLSDYQVFFKKSKEVDGINFGDIFYKKEGETSSLTQALIKENVMIEDKELFSKIETSRIDNKIFHLQALRQASKKHEDARLSIDLSFLMDEVFMRNTSRGISLASDCELSEKKAVKNISKSELLKKMRRKSELRKKEMLSCTESEREDPLLENGRPKTFQVSSSSNEKASGISKLRNMINRRKSAQTVEHKSCTEEATSGSELNIAVNTNSDSSLSSNLAALKLQTEKQKENLHVEESDKETRGEAKLLKSSSVSMYIPGGLRCTQKKKSKTSKCGNQRGSRKSFQMEDLNSSNELDMQRQNHGNSQHIGNRVRSKYVQNTDNSWSNTSDATDVEVLKNPARQGSSVNGNTSEMDTDSKDCNVIYETKELKYAHGIIRNMNRIERPNSSNIPTNTSDGTDQKLPENQVEGDKQTIQTGEECNESAECTTENAQESQMVVKPFCSCSQCHFWTTSETWEKGCENFTEEQICKRKKLRPPSLMLKEERKEQVKLAAVDFRCMTKLEKEASFKILVHGRLIPQPVDRVVEAPFHSSIHRSLTRLKYVRTKKIQSYIWPAISRSMNVCYIHRKRSGKTLGYLPPVCSFLLERDERYSDLKSGGPITIVLGKTSTQCEEIYDLANRLVEGVGYKKPKIVLVTYPFQFVNMSSVDMLITIPPILIELLKKNATNLKRLCHLVLESTDVILEKYSEEMKSVIGSVESMLLQRGTRQSVQMIISGEHWTLKLEKFVMVLRDIPLIALGDYLEASIYGGIKLKVKLLAAKAKCDAVVDILREKWKFHKTIIICDGNEEIELIKTALDLGSISYIAITDDLTKEEAGQNESNWETQRGGEYIVLICTDEVLHTMLSITSASLLIHYSLPSKWSFWIKRFYCLLENYKCPLTRNNDKLKCEAYILTDELCVDQIPRLLSLLKNYNVSLQQFEPVCKQIEIEKEEVKIKNEIPLCSPLKKFGYCHVENCPERHLLDSGLDRNATLPQNGTIKYTITKLIDVNHLKVNIVEHKDIDGKIIDYKSQKDLDDEKLTAILNLTKERADPIVEQSCYAYWDDEDFNDMFRECIVENIQSDVVNIVLKSNGKKITVSKSKIFQLPGEFIRDHNTDSFSTDIIIANFKPPYKDDQFSASAYFKLNKFITDDVGLNDSVFVSNVCLQLGDTIWVNTIREEVNVYDVNLTKSDLTKELVKRNLAEANDEHIENLYALCEEAGIVLPKYIVPIQELIKREPPQAAPQWAFLEMDYCNTVYFCSAVTPDEIYMRLEKFDSVLTNLEKDLAEVVARAGSKQDFAIIEGRFYLAKDAMEEKYIRVLVKKVESGKALCFSVDYGDEFVARVEDIRYLSNYMIQRLPFQAIHCRLFGITAIEGEWPVEAVDVLYKNFTFETDSDIYRTLYAKCVIYEKGMRKGQSLFSISLKDVFEKPIIVNKLLIDCGWATLISGANIVDFEVPITMDESEEEYFSDTDIDEVEKVKKIVEASKLISSNQIVPKSSSMNNYENYDENDLEFFCGGSGDDVDTFIHFINTMDQQTLVDMKAETRNTTLPAIEAAPFEVDYLTPDVYWSQTNKFIDLYIKLPNVKTYKVKITKSRILNFETTIDDKKYVVNLVLYEAVEKDFKHTLGGLEVKITLKKKKEEEWFKLSRSKNRLRNVHYLVGKEEVEGDEKDKLFLDFGDDMKAETDNESDGAIFDVYSDVDSEYEQELQEDFDRL